MEQPSKRKPNWTEAELDALSKGVAENINMLKGKFSLSVTNDFKNRCWATITQRINAANPSAVSRGVADVKKKWQDLQSIGKKKEAARRRSLNATGGGPSPEDTTKSWEKAIISTFTNTQLEGIAGGEDTSSVSPCEPLSESVISLNIESEGLSEITVAEDNAETTDCAEGESSKVFSEPKEKPSKKRDHYFMLEEMKLQRVELYRMKKIKIMEEMLVLKKRSTKALEEIRDSIKADQGPLCLSPIIKIHEM
ncbi:uncharacterized protein LOC127712938 [Mytilus californianus]|uniref:uncharacterized protein LOC127712938 n=1 Tax=Mytilus californianus TaxID=6549 RepID=UPI0022456C82|nr:uncharacterized protein LOC127712938 [Mytilus californianus]